LNALNHNEFFHSVSKRHYTSFTEGVSKGDKQIQSNQSLIWRLF